MSRSKVFHLIFIIAAIIWMVVIFMFSAKPADDSTVESNRVGRLIGHIFINDFDNLSEAEQQVYVDSIDHTVRKCAHATEYAVLGVLVLMAAGFFTEKSWLRFLTGIAVAVLYAGTDEIHQLFVEGRSCQFTDFIIDGSGALFGCAVALLIIVLFRRSSRCS